MISFPDEGLSVNGTALAVGSLHGTKVSKVGQYQEDGLIVDRMRRWQQQRKVDATMGLEGQV